MAVGVVGSSAKMSANFLIRKNAEMVQHPPAIREKIRLRIGVVRVPKTCFLMMA